MLTMNGKQNVVIIVLVCIALILAGSTLYYSLRRKRQFTQHLTLDEVLKKRTDMNVRLLQERNPITTM